MKKLLILLTLLWPAWLLAQNGVVVGDATATPDATLDVRGDARIQTVPTDNAGTNLMIHDPATGEVRVLDPSAFANPTGALTWDGTNWNYAPNDWGTQVVVGAAPLIGDGTSANPLELAGGGANGDILVWDGTTWVTQQPTGDDWGADVVNIVPNTPISGDGTVGNPLTFVTGGAVDDVLTWDGTQWIAQPQVGDDWGTQAAVVTGILTGDGTAGNPLMLDGTGATNGDVLTWNGTAWTPATATTYTAGTGINITAGNVIENTDPGSDINLTGGTDIDVTGTYPNLTVGFTGTIPTYTAGDGINITPGDVIENTLSLTGGTDIAVTGTFPNLTIDYTGTSVTGGDVTSTTPILSIGGTPTGAALGAGYSIDLAAGTTDEVLVYNGTNWVSAQSPLNFTGGTDISISGTYPNFTVDYTGTPGDLTEVTGSNGVVITNGTGPVPDISLPGTGAGGDVLTWNAGTGEWEPQAPSTGTTYTAGTGINITGADVIENTSPDQTVTLTSSNGLVPGGTYPNLEIDLPAGTLDEVLTFDGTNWVSAPAPSGADDWGTQLALTSGFITGDGDGTPIQLSAGTTDNDVLTWNAGTSQWESQPSASGADNWGGQVVVSDATLDGDGDGTALSIAQQGATVGQVLTWDGTTWQPQDAAETDYTGLGDVNVNTTTERNQPHDWRCYDLDNYP